MRHAYLSSLLLSLFTSISLSLSAAPDPAADLPPVVVGQSQAGLIDLNVVDSLTLQKSLTGIGKSKADAIVAYREVHGNFTSIDELLEVKGIGKALLESNRHKVMVN